MFQVPSQVACKGIYVADLSDPSFPYLHPGTKRRCFHGLWQFFPLVACAIQMVRVVPAPSSLPRASIQSTVFDNVWRKKYDSSLLRLVLMQKVTDGAARFSADLILNVALMASSTACLSLQPCCFEKLCSTDMMYFSEVCVFDRNRMR